ncbi:MAG: ATP-dependent DNA helicase UvrD2 [Actinomycetota bacterium]
MDSGDGIGTNRQRRRDVNRRAEQLLDGLNESQVRAVTETAAPLVVLAGAGSGKTRVLTRRIAWRVLTGQTDPQRVLTLTFTRKAAAELRDRQRDLGLRDRIPAGTFHAIAMTQLRQRWTERRTIPPTLLDRKVRFVAQLLGSRRGVEVTDVVSEMDWARARLIAPEDYHQAALRAGRTPPLPAGDLEELLVRYQQEKRRKRLVDFDDLLTLAIRDLRADPDYAAGVRWRHRHFYVDEFQDVNPLQYALLQEWLGDRSDLFIVGDPNQAIYGWNGADPGLLGSMASRPDTTVVQLADNYRSTPQVLRLAGATLGPIGAAKLTAHRGAGPAPSLTSYATDRAEADGIADAMLRERSWGEDWSKQAVLVRTNAQLVVIEQALADARIPTRVRSGPGPLGSAEVKGELQAIGRDGIDLIGRLEDLDERLSAIAAEQTNLNVERYNNLAALSRVIHEYLSLDPNPTGPGLLSWVDTLQRGDVDDRSDAVDLVTFHGAKGLEWPVVHLAGLEDGFVPIAYATTDAQLDEERRLLYVALTRAEERLHLSWAKERTFGTNTVKRQPAPLLEPLAAAIAEMDPEGPGRPDWRDHIQRTRQRIPTAAPAPDRDRQAELLDELRRWRTRRARAAGVPPHVILTDQTLKVIAEQRPAGTGQLATMPGMRPVKLQRYGDELLAMVNDSVTPDARLG